MWALFRTYNQVTDSNIIYSFIGVFDTFELANKMKEQLKEETKSQYHDYYISEININTLYETF